MDITLQGGHPCRPRKRKLLIVDDHHFFADCLRLLIEAEPDLEVCAITSDPRSVNDCVARHGPDLLLIDLTLGRENGLEVGEELRRRAVGTPILFMSTLRSLAPHQLARVPRARFAAKHHSPGRFVAAVRDALRFADEAPASVLEGTALVAAH